MKEKFLRQPTKAEIRYIVTKIWGICIEFETLRENDEMDSFYKDALEVLRGEKSIDWFSSDYVCDTYDDLMIDTFYETFRYLIKKGIIKK